MTLKGKALLALWNDIAPEREAEYDRWHTIEHVPERVSVTGIHEGRRYVNRAREVHRYFTLYDVEGGDVFQSPEYVDLLEHGTPWSESMRPDFRNFVRAPCRTERSSGLGIGAAIACLALAEPSCERIDPALDAVLTMPGVTACHWGKRLGGLPTVAFRSPPKTTAEARPFDTVLFIEALDRPAAEGALAGLKEQLGAIGLPSDFGADVFDLTFVFPGADAAERRRHRRPAWGPATY
jgi:hypothetical protein